MVGGSWEQSQSGRDVRKPIGDREVFVYFVLEGHGFKISQKNYMDMRCVDAGRCFESHTKNG
jgi:hypothetical protein